MQLFQPLLVQPLFLVKTDMFDNSCYFLSDSLGPQVFHHVILQFLIKSIEFWSIVLEIVSLKLTFWQVNIDLISYTQYILYVDFWIQWRTLIHNALSFSSQNHCEIAIIFIVFLIFILVFILILLLFLTFFLFLFIIEITWTSTLEYYSYINIITLFL